MFKHSSKCALFLFLLIMFLITLFLDEAEGVSPLFQRGTIFSSSGFDEEYRDAWPDMLMNPLSLGRSRLRSGLWTNDGIIFLYSKAYFASSKVTCLFGLAIKLIKFYSCFPVYGFEISKRCALTTNPLDCARKPAEKNDEIDSRAAMVQEGVLQKMEAAEDYVMFLSDGVQCASHLGRVGKKQELWMLDNPSCMNGGTLIHEMIHALGYGHEHSRLDRDDYIDILDDNIIEGNKFGFRKLDSAYFQDFGPYDYLSLMHYGALAHSKNPNRLLTIYTKNESVLFEIGQRTILRMGDKVKIRSVTKCPETTYEQHVQAVLNLQSTQNLYTGEHTALTVITTPCLNARRKFKNKSKHNSVG